MKPVFFWQIIFPLKKIVVNTYIFINHLWFNNHGERIETKYVPIVTKKKEQKRVKWKGDVKGQTNKIFYINLAVGL